MTAGDTRKQMFLQSMMSRGILDSQEVKKVMIECGVQVTSNEEIVKFVQEINKAIAPLNLEIKKGTEEHDGSIFYCLVNTVESPISRLSSTYTANELELFKKLVEQIVISQNGMLGSLAALALTEKLGKRMGKEEAENFFNRLERDKWIKKDSSGKISLTVRSIVELDQYLKEMHPDFVKMCYLCSMLCLTGETCESCGTKIHRKCANTHFARHGNNKKCPLSHCRAPWGQTVLP